MLGLSCSTRVFDVHCSRRVLVPWPGINPGPLHWEQEVLATGQPTKEVPPQIFISEVKRPSFSDSIYRGKLHWTCDQRSSGLRLWRGCGRMDRGEPGRLAVRVHPPRAPLLPLPSWRGCQAEMSRGSWSWVWGGRPWWWLRESGKQPQDGNREESGLGGASIHQVSLVKEVFKISASHLDTNDLCRLFCFPRSMNWAMFKSLLCWCQMTSKPIRR